MDKRVGVHRNILAVKIAFEKNEYMKIKKRNCGASVLEGVIFCA